MLPEIVSPGPILIVDDDPAIVEFVTLTLSDEGYQCATAANGVEAIRRVSEIRPALCLLDISMPLMDGRAFYTWLRAHGYEDIPVVVMTAGRDATRTRDELGAQGALAKPFELTHLVNIVRRWAA